MSFKIRPIISIEIGIMYLSSFSKFVFWTLGLLDFIIASLLFGIPFYILGEVESPNIPVVLVIYIVRLWLAFVFGYMCGRLFLRLFPIPFKKEKPSLKVIHFNIVLALYIIINCLWIPSTWVLLITQLPFHLAILIPLLLSVSRRHNTNLLDGNTPFVLFLRRFNGYGDRSMLVSVLRKSEPGVPVAFLISPQNKLVTRDPFLTLLAGFNVKHPFLSMPIYSISENETWAINVESLVKIAKKVIIDVSQPSESIAHEIHLLNLHNILDRTLFICEKDTQSTHKFLSDNNINMENDNVNCCLYKESWIRAIPRMIFGFIVLFFAITFLDYVLDRFVLREYFMTSVTWRVAKMGVIFVILCILHYFFFFKSLPNRYTEQSISKHLFLPVDSYARRESVGLKFAVGCLSVTIAVVLFIGIPFTVNLFTKSWKHDSLDESSKFLFQLVNSSHTLEEFEVKLNQTPMIVYARYGSFENSMESLIRVAERNQEVESKERLEFVLRRYRQLQQSSPK